MEEKTDNELIAEFMGGTIGKRLSRVHINNLPEPDYHADELKYDTSWDWLMPVVEKCKTLCAGFEIYSDQNGYVKVVFYNSLKPTISSYWKGKGKSTIEATYEAVLLFIKVYNSLSTNNTKE